MDGIILYILLTVLAVFIYWNSDQQRKRISKALSKVPGPTPLPFIGSLHVVMGLKERDYFKKLDEITKQHGPIFKMWNGHIPEVHVSSAEYMEEVFRSTVNIEKATLYRLLHAWLGQGLLTSGGQKWHARRKLLTPAFHFKILESFQRVFAEKSKILAQKLEREVGNSEGFDVFPYITGCALDIICETAMGTKIHAQDDSHSPYVAAIHEVAELLIWRLVRPWLQPDFLFYLTKGGKRFKECLDILHSFTRKVIRERKQSMSEKKDDEDQSNDLGTKRRVAFLDLLLDASEGGAALSDEDIREEVDTFMFEGHDTTTASICWTLFLLGNHPDVQVRVFEEQAAIFQDSDRLPTMQDLAEMNYLEQVIKESLRLYPSVWLIGRRLTEDTKIGEYDIPAGIQVNIRVYHIHRDPKHFPDPDKFDPDRFLPEQVRKRHPFAYVPFSAGSRNCIGQKFALLEEKTLLSAVLRRFRVKALDRPEDITLMAGLILKPLGGLRLALQRR